MRKSSFLKNESGLAVVEATILLPVCIIMVVAVYYASIFLCQKANLQANLENTLVYYKNTYSDTYIVPTKTMTYSREEQKVDAVGSKYETPTAKFPYRFFGMELKSGNFEKFFRSMCGYMFFDTGDNVKLSVDSTNYVIYKRIHATAVQTVRPAVSLSLVGLNDSFVIKAESEVVVTDGDDFVRNMDFAVDIISKTKLGEKASELVGKLTEVYGTIKEKFGVK